mgnify:CR=1 FL=1
MVDRQLKMSGDPGDQNVHRPDRVACPETLDLFSPKAPPHQAHSKTSRDAAIKIAGKAGTLRRLVYDSLVIHGAATDRGLASTWRAALSDQGVSASLRWAWSGIQG